MRITKQHLQKIEDVVGRDCAVSVLAGDISGTIAIRITAVDKATANKFNVQQNFEDEPNPHYAGLKIERFAHVAKLSFDEALSEGGDQAE